MTSRQSGSLNRPRNLLGGDVPLKRMLVSLRLYWHAIPRRSMLIIWHDDLQANLDYIHSVFTGFQVLSGGNCFSRATLQPNVRSPFRNSRPLCISHLFRSATHSNNRCFVRALKRTSTPMASVISGRYPGNLSSLTKTKGFEGDMSTDHAYKTRSVGVETRTPLGKSVPSRVYSWYFPVIKHK